MTFLSHRNSDGLQLRVIGQSGFAQLAANAALLESTEGGRRVEHVVTIDPHRAGTYAFGKTMCLRNVPCPYRGGEAEIRVVRPADDFIDILKFQHAKHRSE